MVILDGKALAAKILAGLKSEIGDRKLSLAAVVLGDNPVIQKFITQKEKVAEKLGVDFRVYDYEAAISTNELRTRIATIVHDADPDGIIIQLPLPEQLNTQYILNSVPPEKDVDMLSARAVGDFAVGKSKILPPVVGAIRAFFEEYGIDYRSGHVVVVGAGTLVGKPVATWLANEKVSFTVVDENTPDISEFTQKADILIVGIGKPGFITGDMMKEEAVVMDAGTSEAGGKLAGDVDYDSVSPKAAYLTPVPGGIGPLTVVMIFRNLLVLSRKGANSSG
ncbi:MAG: bifunctional 5,10-methylenetetrahydrofolate dehydrogenase/5,10-methenyltetrahydrofolate cyclohydrolase [Patescibacteria group bacterium]